MRPSLGQRDSRRNKSKDCGIKLPTYKFTPGILEVEIGCVNMCMVCRLSERTIKIRTQ